MARITKIEHDKDSSFTLNRTTTECRISELEVDGETYLDIRTFGSEERMTKGHASQVMQFDRESARRLYRLLRTTFDFD